MISRSARCGNFTIELVDYADSKVPILAEKVFKWAQYPVVDSKGMIKVKVACSLLVFLKEVATKQR